MDRDREPDAGPVLNLVGERVALGPLRQQLLGHYQRWINDFEVTRFLGAPQVPMTREAEVAWYEETVRSKSSVHFTVYTCPELRPIGSTGLHHLDFGNGHAEFGILIGEKDAWGQGFGTETARLVLRYAFDSLNLHSVYLTVFSYNERGMRAYRRAGFRECGRRREARLLAGQRYDVVTMECLAREFRAEQHGAAAGG
jgi:diamine N-acetyltransferase